MGGSQGVAVRLAGWNHNNHYLPWVLGLVPAGCGRALDVGCGSGLLTRLLAEKCGEVVGIDSDRASLERARNLAGDDAKIVFVEGDVMSYPFGGERFDCIAVVAALHHLPLEQALRLFRDLLRPGGVLIVVGLARRETLVDTCWSAAGLVSSRLVRLWRGVGLVGAPIADPRETLEEIRRVAAEVLPGAVIRRRLYFRYSLVWRKP